MAKKQDEIFIEISNRDIYQKLLDLEKLHEDNAKTNTLQHNQIITRQDKTNGRVTVSKWLGSTALALVFILMGFLFQHLSN